MATPLFTARMKSVGNPDFGQYAPISEPATLKATTLRGLLDKMEEYRDYWNLGGGNWVEPKITQGKTVIGWVSYNGRVWDRPSSLRDYREGAPAPVEIKVQ